MQNSNGTIGTNLLVGPSQSRTTFPYSNLAVAFTPRNAVTGGSTGSGNTGSMPDSGAEISIVASLVLSAFTSWPTKNKQQQWNTKKQEEATMLISAPESGILPVVTTASATTSNGIARSESNSQIGDMGNVVRDCEGPQVSGANCAIRILHSSKVICIELSTVRGSRGSQK